MARILKALARTAGFPAIWVAPDADGAERDLGVLEKVAAGAFVFIAGEGGSPYDEEALYLALRAGARYVGLLASRQNVTSSLQVRLRTSGTSMLKRHYSAFSHLLEEGIH